MFSMYMHSGTDLVVLEVRLFSKSLSYVSLCFFLVGTDTDTDTHTHTYVCMLYVCTSDLSESVEAEEDTS